MKDITFTLTGRRLRREAAWLLVAVLLANALNVYAIVSRKTDWSELATCLPFVLGIALVLHVTGAVVRLLVFGLRRLARGRASN